MAVKSNKKRRSGDIIGAIIPTFFCSIFLIIGILLFLYGYANKKDVDAYINTPLISVDNVKSGQVVKFKLKSPYTPVLESAYTHASCAYYRLEYFSYREHRSRNSSSGTLVKSLDRVESAPDQITLLSSDYPQTENQYVIPVKNPLPDCYLEHFINFRKLWSQKEYQATTKTEFKVGDDVLQESVISQGEDVLLFGRVKRITSDTLGENYVIEFQSSPLGNPLDNLPLFLVNLFKTAFTNELSTFIISTKTDSEVLEDLSANKETGLMNTGLIICLVLLVIISGFWIKYFRGK